MRITDNQFPNRREAGRFLAGQLRRYQGRTDVQILALPRGGVPVGFEVAQALGVPLDVFLVRKLGVPGHEELAMGAIASGGLRVINEEITSRLGIAEEVIDAVAGEELHELLRREELYRDQLPPLEVKNRVVVLVDDGLATGSSMRAAVMALREQQPARIVVAVPVASTEARRQLEKEVDEVVCAMTPEPFEAVGAWYSDFGQTTDEEVRDLLRQAREAQHKRDLSNN
ncbi:MAG TPA: phosphoribosyltransferase [Methylomirabilota bacterium]|nr:phosphoribosyltransferase [Methylomirabilota bacterium]